MDVYTDAIRDLPLADKLKLVECIWDDLAKADRPIPLPEWAISEAARRRDEMVKDPDSGLTDEEAWKRIEQARNG